MYRCETCEYFKRCKNVNIITVIGRCTVNPEWVNIHQEDHYCGQHSGMYLREILEETLKESENESKEK